MKRFLLTGLFVTLCVTIFIAGLSVGKRSVNGNHEDNRLQTLQAISTIQLIRNFEENNDAFLRNALNMQLDTHVLELSIIIKNNENEKMRNFANDVLVSIAELREKYPYEQEDKETRSVVDRILKDVLGRSSKESKENER